MGAGGAVKDMRKWTYVARYCKIPWDSLSSSVLLLPRRQKSSSWRVRSETPPTPGLSLAIADDTVQFSFRDET